MLGVLLCLVCVSCLILVTLRALTLAVLFPVDFLPPYTPPPGLRLHPGPDGAVATITHGAHLAADGRPQVLFCHGNAVTLDEGTDAVCQRLSERLGTSVTMLDYPGYGRSEGRPSEGSVNAAVGAAIAQLADNPVILVGQSVGTGPCVHWASRWADRRPLAAVVLVSPFKSVLTTVLPVSVPLLDMFASHRRIAAIRCPVLIVHGTRDTTIPHSHGRELARACASATFESVCAGHNDVDWVGRAADFIRTSAG